MKSESDFIEALILSQSLSSCQPGPLSTFPFTQLSTAHVCFTEQIFWAAKLNATCKIECVQHPPGFLEEKCLDPPHTSTPPGSTCRVFTSPPPPLAIRKQQGGGTSNLVPNFQNDILLPVIRVSPKEISKGLSSCQPDEKLKNIGLTCTGT